MSTPDKPVPVYFSHSYRTTDREINEFFWRLFWDNKFLFTVDPKSDNLSVPYLELMVKRAACFAAVVTERPEQRYYRCSPFILFEYGLAVQAQKPRLVFVEEGVSAAYFQDANGIQKFNRSRVRLQSERDLFRDRIAVLAEESRAYRNVDVRLRGKVGLLLQEHAGSSTVYSGPLPRIESLLRDLGYTPEAVDLRFESNLRLALNFDNFDFLILDVCSSDISPSVIPSWVYPYVNGRFLPAIKLLHLPESGDASVALSPLVKGQILRDVALTDDPILFWRDEEELLTKLKRHLKKFEDKRTLFESLNDGYRYFRSLGRTDGKVFISNASDANTFSARLSERLGIENIVHFHYKFRNTIPLGSEWAKELNEEVIQSRLFVALITQGYLDSEWCRMEYELAEKLRRQNKITIIPYFLEDVTQSSLTIEQGRLLYAQPKSQHIRTIVEDIDKKLRDMPVPSSAPSKTKVDVDVALITILPEEYQAVLKQLDHQEDAPRRQKQPNRHAWVLGDVLSPTYRHPYRVIVAMAGQAGNNAGVLVVKNTVERWNPRYVLLVGIAGGLPKDGLKKGDIVISNVIWGYDYGKLGKSFDPRHDLTYRADAPLVTAAQALASKAPRWQPPPSARAPEQGANPEIKVGPVASGDKVVDDITNAFFQSVLAAFPRLMAIEMEGAGAAAAIQDVREAGKTVGFAMIRGISDMPRTAESSSDIPLAEQTKERDTWKQFASEAAAAFAVHLIRSGWPVPPRQERF
jgi:nucleoside phosphorylase